MSIFSCLLSMFSKELFFQDISGQLFLNIHLIAIPVGYQYCKTLDSFPECQLKLSWGFYYYFENIWHNLTSGISFNLLPSFKIERAYVRFLLMYLNIYLPPRIRPFIWENLGYQKKSCGGMLWFQNLKPPQAFFCELWETLLKILLGKLSYTSLYPTKWLWFTGTTLWNNRNHCHPFSDKITTHHSMHLTKPILEERPINTATT